MIDEIALISGVTPRLTLPYTSIGSNEVPGPVVKYVIMKSSSEIVKASSAPPMNG